MPLVPPTLDNRTFEQLVAEVRRRIPTFTPEWTDLNDSDPGMTLAQIFAFMSEQLLFQVNQVPNKGLITFLKLVGAELHPATPAVADVTFIPIGTSGPGSALTFDIDERTQVQTAAPPPGEKTPITFETIRPFTVVNGSLVDVVSRGCDFRYTSQKAANDSLTATFRPFGAALTAHDAFHFVLDLNVVVGGPAWPSGTFRVRVNVAGSSDVGEPGSPTSSSTPTRIAWSYSIGSVTVSGEKSVQFAHIEPSLDSTLELTRSGYLEFSFPAADVMKRAAGDVQPKLFQNRFVLRAQIVLPNGYGSSPPELKNVRLNTVTARSLVTVREEVLGRSTGLPFQRFQLANAPVFPGSTSIRINEATEGGGGVKTWAETLDLFAAGPQDRIYQLIPATGEILFGDGRFGKIPPPDDGSDPAGNIEALFYQYGGGSSGNVGVGTLTRVLPKAGLPSFDATNVLPAKGGDDEEPVSQGVARAPAVVRSRYRAVSAVDFEALAKETPDARIARAHALPSTRPGCRAGMSPGSVTIILVPNAPFSDTIRGPIDLPPHVAAAVSRYLDQRRLITTEVLTTPATFREVTVDATVLLVAGASLTATKTAAAFALNRYFHALIGGDDGLGWPFGGTVFFSRVFQRLLDVDGVLRVDALSIALDGGAGVACRDVPIHPGELLFSGPHVVRIKVPG